MHLNKNSDNAGANALYFTWSADSASADDMALLADNANDEGICWPSYQNIADHCEVTKRSVMSHVAKLEEMGLLKRQYRKTDDDGKPVLQKKVN